jgi:hypothetical protein
MSKAEKIMIDALKRQLPRGYTTTLSKKAGCTPQYVCLIINSGNINHPIWDMAIALQKAEQMKLQRKKEKACASLNI